MGLSSIYLGHQTWGNLLSDRRSIAGFEKAVEDHSQIDESLASARAIRVVLNERDYQIALESGLGALSAGMSYSADDSSYQIEFGFDKLAAGIDRLNADFNVLLGDVIWKVEMQEETLSNILHEIRLAEFEREARAYRSRAEKAYLNGWYEEALADFLEAEKRNYPDFGVLRSIANICLYHLINLTTSLDYFRKAAKYSRPSDARQSAEAHYFAGVVCGIQQQFRESLDHFGEAIALNPALVE